MLRVEGSAREGVHQRRVPYSREACVSERREEAVHLSNNGDEKLAPSFQADSP